MASKALLKSLERVQLRLSRSHPVAERLALGESCLLNELSRRVIDTGSRENLRVDVETSLQ